MGKLSVQEVSGGFTDDLVIGYEDFSVANAGTLADNATKTFTYVIPAGYAVSRVSASLEVAFDDSGGGDELTMIAGDGSDDDGFLAAAALHVDQTEITYVLNTGAYMDNENGKLYTVADTIDIKFTPNISTGTDYSLNELTSGRVKLKFELINCA
jgi:hypothetical protein